MEGKKDFLKYVIWVCDFIMLNLLY